MNKDNEASNKALMAEVGRAFGHADLRPLFNALDDNVVWKSASPAAFFRFGGTHAKRPGVTEVMALLSSAYHFLHFEATQIVAEGDTVWGLFDIKAIHLPTRNNVAVEIAVRWTVREGKIMEHQAFFDTASLLMQQGALGKL